MITIFNGKERRLGQGQRARVFAQIDIEMREHLHLLKGARLAVLLAIALHADENGWAWPSYETLQRETGYSENTIITALAELCHLEIQGQRVLLRYQPIGDGGRFASNRYLIFPSPEEVAQYEDAGVAHLGSASRLRTVTQKLGDGEPSPSFPCTENWVTNHNHDQTITTQEEEEGDGREKIARMLQDYGVFTQTAQEIAALLVARGLSCEEAEEQFLAVLRATDGDLGRAVHRLRQGWDPAAPARARAAARRRHYAAVTTDDEPPESGPDDASEPAPEDPNDNDRIWQSVLAHLQLGMTRATFDTWLWDTRLVACDDGIFVVAVRNGYARDWLEHRLCGLIAQAITYVTGQPSPTVQFVVPD